MQRRTLPTPHSEEAIKTTYWNQILLEVKKNLFMLLLQMCHVLSLVSFLEGLFSLHFQLHPSSSPFFHRNPPRHIPHLHPRPHKDSLCHFLIHETFELVHTILALVVVVVGQQVDHIVGRSFCISV